MIPAMRKILESADASGVIPVQSFKQDEAVLALLYAGAIELPPREHRFRVTATGRALLAGGEKTP